MSIILKVMFCSLGGGVAKWLQAGEKIQILHCKNNKTSGFFFLKKKKKEKLWGSQKSPKFDLQCIH